MRLWSRFSCVILCTTFDQKWWLNGPNRIALCKCIPNDFARMTPISTTSIFQYFETGMKFVCKFQSNKNNRVDMWNNQLDYIRKISSLITAKRFKVIINITMQFNILKHCFFFNSPVFSSKASLLCNFFNDKIISREVFNRSRKELTKRELNQKGVHYSFASNRLTCRIAFHYHSQNERNRLKEGSRTINGFTQKKRERTEWKEYQTEWMNG